MVASPAPINAIDVPAFQAMPSSVSRISTGQIVQLDSNNEILNKNAVLANMQVKREVSNAIADAFCVVFSEALRPIPPFVTRQTTIAFTTLHSAFKHLFWK